MYIKKNTYFQYCQNPFYFEWKSSEFTNAYIQCFDANVHLIKCYFKYKFLIFISRELSTKMFVCNIITPKYLLPQL